MPRLEHPTGDKAGPEQILSPGRFMASPAPADAAPDVSTADLLNAADPAPAEQPTAGTPAKRPTKRRK